MSKHASSSHSQSKTSNNVIATSKKLSSSSAERDQDAWAKSNAKELLRVFMDWKGAGTAPSDCPATHTCYHATEGTDKDLYYNLALIYKKYGPLHMHHEGRDSLAQHWVSGWNTNIDSYPVQKVILCVCMEDRLPSQLPVLEKLAPHQIVHTGVTSSHSDEDDVEVIVMSEEESDEPDTDDAVWSGEEITENEEPWCLSDSEEWLPEKPKEKAYTWSDYV